MTVKEKALSFLTLFSSASTLVCCALPALFVTLGMGAAFAGLVSQVPQLIWMSENKLWFFGFGGTMLVLAGIGQYQARSLPCPIDAAKAKACDKTRRWSKRVYALSVLIYAVGATFAFGSALFT